MIRVYLSFVQVWSILQLLHRISCQRSPDLLCVRSRTRLWGLDLVVGTFTARNLNLNCHLHLHLLHSTHMPRQKTISDEKAEIIARAKDQLPIATLVSLLNINERSVYRIRKRIREAGDHRRPLVDHRKLGRKRILTSADTEVSHISFCFLVDALVRLAILVSSGKHRSAPRHHAG